MTTSTRKRSIPRQRQPELERDFARSPSLGYEAPEETGLVRCLAHGFPSPLVRWPPADGQPDANVATAPGAIGDIAKT